MCLPTYDEHDYAVAADDHDDYSDVLMMVMIMIMIAILMLVMMM